MLQISGYRVPYHSTHVLCPLCTPTPGRSLSIPLQPCCFYPSGIHREVPVPLPGSHSSLTAFRQSSFQPYRVALRLPAPGPFSRRQAPSNENHSTAQAQPDGSSSVDVSSSKTNTKRKRRKRTIFTSEQLSRLESEFDEQQYMIKIWFQNRRIKWRKENKQNFPDFLANPFSVACALRRNSGMENWNG
ncbi:Homeobox protein not2 [Acropora cervicornis]|uniref:Homeobox protein not2 n=1 Tax=Acropora cervicornis TaxID=6130 RepID=A0AAD9QQT3_ACRCE|nr:Homeobox protein not2 [Acropora cervicornis]